jgi:hypothetical protein
MKTLIDNGNDNKPLTCYLVIDWATVKDIIQGKLYEEESDDLIMQASIGLILETSLKRKYSIINAQHILTYIVKKGLI